MVPSANHLCLEYCGAHSDRYMAVLADAVPYEDASLLSAFPKMQVNALAQHQASVVSEQNMLILFGSKLAIGCTKSQSCSWRNCNLQQ